ncbi:MAG: DUF2330 domain-containing protein [Acidimicrobiia bacterium]
MRRLPILAVLVVVVTLAGTTAAWACGSLVAPNGAVQLLRTSTLAAHHDGVEHYITNFEFAGEQASFGSIIPLPGEPTTVERAGDWTLQRLQREVAPPVRVPRTDEVLESAAADVDVLDQVRIDSLDVTILRGGGQDVAAWADEQGFTLTDDTPEVLEFYSQRSPYFMAAKFDAEAASEDGFQGGDGIPVHLAIPLGQPWVPLRILATGKPADEIVQADVFLLTDEKPELLAGSGLSLERSEPADDLLLDDLRSDTNMEWVPEDAWFTYLKLETPVSDLGYDLATSLDEESPSVVDTGLVHLDEMDALEVPGSGAGSSWPWQGTAAIVVAVVLTLVCSALLVRTPARFSRQA